MADLKDLAKIDYLKGIKQKQICKNHGININTLKSWISRYKWAEEKRRKGIPKNTGGAPLNNKNAVGHGAPKGNKNAEKFGFFSKYLPDETLELMDSIVEKKQIDILWEQIVIQYAAIIRAQKIMYVAEKDEIIREVKKEEQSDLSQKIEYELQFAWERQASFLNAQSRAMSELRSLIKQYDNMINSNLNLATEEQKARIEVLKSRIVNNEKNREEKIDQYFTKLEEHINVK